MKRKLVTLVLAAVVAFVVVPNFLPRSVFYRNRRPTKIGMFYVRAYGALAGYGLPPAWSVALEVTGKRSGTTYSIPLVVADYQGEQYLVSMMGNDVAWVRNVHASEGRAVIRHGSRRPVVLEDVPVESRAPILKAYLKRAMGARPHFEIEWDAPMTEFERIAANYPVFRVREPQAA